MRITGPLVVDVSKYNYRVNCQELIDGGVASIIVGLYKYWDGIRYILHPNCQRICELVAASSLIMQAYYYYYPEANPQNEADWFTGQIFQHGYPVKFCWADCEDYSFNMSEAARSEKYRMFTEAVQRSFPKTGVYTGEWFTHDYAPDMDKWMQWYPAWVSHYGRQPKKKIMLTWDQLKANWLPDYDILLSPGQKTVVGHQFTGDRMMLPGVYAPVSQLSYWIYKYRMPLDVSMFTKEFLTTLGSMPLPSLPPQHDYTDYVVVQNAINVRSGPASTTALVRLAYSGEVLHVRNNVAPENGYVQMTDLNWVFAAYIAKQH